MKKELKVIKTFYESGELREKYRVIKGTYIKHGYCFKYLKNGKVFLKENYVNGKLHGKRIFYWESGEAWRKENYVNGNLYKVENAQYHDNVPMADKFLSKRRKFPICDNTLYKSDPELYKKKKNNANKFSISENIKKKLNRILELMDFWHALFSYPLFFIIGGMIITGLGYYVSNILSGNEMPLYIHIVMIISIILILRQPIIILMEVGLTFLKNKNSKKTSN